MAMAEWFDQQDYIERYSPFGELQSVHRSLLWRLLIRKPGAMKQMQGVNQYNALMNPDGTITSLGNWVSRGKSTRA